MSRRCVDQNSNGKRRVDMRKARTFIVACALVLVACGVWVIAQDKAQPAAASAGGAAPQMTAEQKAMMEAWVKNGTPGPQHEKLKALAGKWDADVSMQMDPATPPEKSKGTMTNTSVYEGRFLTQDY